MSHIHQRHVFPFHYPTFDLPFYVGAMSLDSETNFAPVTSRCARLPQNKARKFQKQDYIKKRRMDFGKAVEENKKDYFVLYVTDKHCRKIIGKEDGLSIFCVKQECTDHLKLKTNQIPMNNYYFKRIPSGSEIISTANSSERILPRQVRNGVLDGFFITDDTSIFANEVLHTKAVRSLSCSPVGDLIATGSDDISKYHCA